MNPLRFLNTRPTSISIEVSSKCPLNCTYCERAGKGENIDIDSYRKITERMQESGTIENAVYCGIGESFMNPMFYQMAGETPVKGITIISSGMLPIEFDKLNQGNNRLKLIIFSIDAVSEDKIKAICGAQYRYDILLDNLAAMNKFKEANPKAMTLLNCTVNEKNYQDLPEIMEFAVRHGFKIVHYSLPWGQEEFIARNYKEIASNIEKARLLAKQNRIITDDPFHSYCCIQIDSILPFINLKGDFFPCGFALHSNYIVGNLIDQSFEELWSSEKYQEFRKGFLCESCFMMRMGKIESGELYASIRQ